MLSFAQNVHSLRTWKYVSIQNKRWKALAYFVAKIQTSWLEDHYVSSYLLSTWSKEVQSTEVFKVKWQQLHQQKQQIRCWALECALICSTQILNHPRTWLCKGDKSMLGSLSTFSSTLRLHFPHWPQKKSDKLLRHKMTFEGRTIQYSVNKYWNCPLNEFDILELKPQY